MSKKITTVPSATVRMFDGAKWDTYKRGSKAHRKAEVRRAAWEATRPSKAERAAAVAERKETNAYLATSMRAAELVPSGSAWTAFKAGERDVERLAAMNAADGLVFRAPKAPADRKASTKGATSAPATPAATVSPKKAAKRRSKAARKAYATRVANGTVARVNGKFVKAGTPVEAPEAKVEKVDAAESVRKGGKKALLWADLSGAGLDIEALKAAGLSTKQLTDLRDALV